MAIGCHREHAERLPTKTSLVLLGRIRGEIRSHLPLEACLQNIRSHYGHRAAVDLDHETAARAIEKLQTERKIRHQTNLMLGAFVRHPYAHRKWIAGVERLIRKRRYQLARRGISALDRHVIVQAGFTTS